MELLDLFFPKRCVSCGKFGSYICSGCLSKIEFIEKPICPICQRQAVGGVTHPGCRSKYGLDGLVVACRYKGSAGIAIRSVKYKWQYDIAKVLVELLVSSFWQFSVPSMSLLVPVPLHSKRRRWRGFNQAEKIARILASQYGLSVSELLRRTRETKTQVGLRRAERLKNVRGVFALKADANIKNKDILLFDDVYTSGATMGECARVLKKAGAKSVWGAAVALG